MHNHMMMQNCVEVIVRLLGLLDLIVPPAIDRLVLFFREAGPKFL